MQATVHLADGEFYYQITHKTKLVVQLATNLIIEFKCYIAPIGETMIIGNDWLKRYDGIIHCAKEMIDFMIYGKRFKIYSQDTPNKEKAKPISIQEIKSDFRNNMIEHFGYISVTNGSEKSISKNNTNKLYAISKCQNKVASKIMSDFKDVLSKPKHGRPVEGGPEMEIIIKEGHGPIAKRPYRLSHTEQQELHKQVNELLEQGYSGSKKCINVWHFRTFWLITYQI